MCLPDEGEDHGFKDTSPNQLAERLDYGATPWKTARQLLKGLNVVSKKVKSLSRVQLFAIPWTVAQQAPPSMGFCRQEYWSGLPFPSPVDLPDPGIELGSPALQADSLPAEPTRNPESHNFTLRRRP